MPIGKMKKHKEMLQHPVLRPHLPETHWFTDSRTSRMLNTYSSVFIKPNHGSGGSGIIRVKRLKKGYEVRRGSSRRIVGSRFVLRAIKSYQKSRHMYLVQKGLRLAKYHGSIFDTRIYLQKPGRKWVISGTAARVAAPHKYVTNYLKGGHAVSLHRVLFSLFKHNRTKADAYFREISKLSVIIAKTINKRHPVRELGVDIAIDKKGRILIIEANSHPGHMLFTQLPDPTMINTIMRNKRLIWK
ncbi:YheC/YheD family protein [Paenibacillus terrae]|uniref:YheC/YheD family protein n=1 Tax=Paenibacillus terrae TaxID=159743 RepID=UPI0011EAF6DB|nr:YheC/YheD family protein [Paenibacillus terrae]